MADLLGSDIALDDQGTPHFSPEVKDQVDLTEIAPIKGILEIDNPGSRQVGQMKTIYDFLLPNSNGTGDMLYQLRQIENRLAPPRLGESRLGKLYNYVKMQNQIKEIEKQRDSLLN